MPTLSNLPKATVWPRKSATNLLFPFLCSPTPYTMTNSTGQVRSATGGGARAWIRFPSRWSFGKNRDSV